MNKKAKPETYLFSYPDQLELVPLDGNNVFEAMDYLSEM